MGRMSNRAGLGSNNNIEGKSRLQLKIDLKYTMLVLGWSKSKWNGTTSHTRLF